jgi:ribosome-binding factor A
VGDEIRAVVAEMLTRGEIKDPRIGFITLTEVVMSPDLRRATIYFSLVGDANAQAEAEKGLNSAAGFIRREVGARIRLKNRPEIVFRFDGSFEHSEKISRLLKGIEVPKDD